jgi:hypothetical protein
MDVKTIVTLPEIQELSDRMDASDRRDIERDDAADVRMAKLEIAVLDNTELTRQIAVNTAPLVSFSKDVEAGAKFLCRLARFVDWSIQKLKSIWFPALAVFVAGYWITHEHQFPELALRLLKLDK